MVGDKITTPLQICQNYPRQLKLLARRPSQFCCNTSLYQPLFEKNSSSKQQYKTCVRDFIVWLSRFVRYKVIVNKNLSFINHTSGIWLLDGYKLAKSWKNDNDVTICRTESHHKTSLLLWCLSCLTWLLVQVSMANHNF